MKKPLHKHIGHHAKKVHGHFTKYLYERDTIFATVWVFLFIFILGSIPLNLGSMNPIKLSLKDFDFNDLTYSQLQEDDTRPVDKRITIVNIGHADREGIALMIDKAAGYGPRVMALDVLLDEKPEEEKDPRQDSILTETFKRHKNLVAAQKLVLSGPEADTITTSGDYIKGAHQYAYVNLFTDKLASVRSYEPFERDWKKKLYVSFSSEIVRLYDSTAYTRLRKRGNSKTLINYTRNQNKIPIIQMDQLMTDNFESSWVKGRILLFGYIAPDNDPEDIADKFFTPMNPKWYGKSWPDMHGIVVHANIISMALDDNYIKKLPSWANWLIAILVCWLHMSFFIRYYLESHIWFHLVAKILQVASAIFFVWLGIYLFDKYRLKTDFKMSLLVIVLAVDVIYFYEAWAVWMHKKFNYKTVFKPHHH